MMDFPPEVLAALREQGRKTGRLGGLARAKKMTAEQRRQSALKASKAASKARRERAEQKRRMAKLEKLADRVTERSTDLVKLNRANTRKRKKATPRD